MIGRQPKAAAPHHALGLWLMRADRRAEVIQELKRAAELAPDDARFAHVYAVALADDDRAKGIEQRSNCSHAIRDTLSALAAFSGDAGASGDVLRYAETDDPSVQSFIKQLEPKLE